MTMLGLHISAALSASSFVSAFGNQQFSNANIGRGFVSVPVNAVKHRGEVNRRRETAGSAAADLSNYKVSGYTINITLGDPGQSTTVVLDTGSFELWVDPDCTTAARTGNSTKDKGSEVTQVDGLLGDPAYCKLLGRYDTDKSSTKSEANIPGRTLTYGDFTTVTIDYWQDKLTLAGLVLDKQVFGVANASNQTAIGIMGMGPPPFGFNNSGWYPLILTTMAKQGLIKSRAFSLDLRDYDNSTGSLIFGGVDKSKYSGSLAKIPFETLQFKVQGQTVTSTSYWVKVSSMGLASPASTSQSKSYDIPNGNFVADLDSGTGAILLPKGMADQVCKDLNGTALSAGDGRNVCYTDCSLRQRPGGLTFGLNGKSITVTYQNLINLETFKDQTSCILAVADSTITTDPPTYILGAPFLRSSYAVFDWDNEGVHLAQAANCGTNIVAIGNGTTAVPEDKGDCSKASSIVVNLALLLITTILGGTMVF